MATITFCCGGECGVAVGGSHWSVNGTAAACTFPTALKRSGARSIRLNPAAQTCNIQSPTFGSGASVGVAKLYFRFASLPIADGDVVQIGTNTSSAVAMGYKNSDGKLYAKDGANFGVTGFTPTLNTWHRLDMRVDMSTWVIDIQIDGTSLGSTDFAGTGATGPCLILGADSTATMDVYFDDIECSATSADYPIGDGSVGYAFVPTSDGTHNIAGTGDFQRGNTAVDILNATTTAYQLIDDQPLPAAVNEADCVRNVAPVNATDYVEVKFGPGTGGSAPTSAPRVVCAICMYHSVSATANNVRCAINDNGTVTNIMSVSATGTSAQYANLSLNDPPSAASVWNINNDGSDGDFLNLRARIYSSDANPDTMVDALMIEASFVDSAPAVAAIGGMQLAMMGCGQM